MRLDKFLKVSRIIKRRTVAKEVSEASHINVNGRIAKPSTEVKEGDIIEINYYKKTMVVKVKSIAQSIKKEDADSMYEIVSVKEN